MEKKDLPAFPLSDKYIKWLKKNGVKEKSIKSYFSITPLIYKNEKAKIDSSYFDVIVSFFLNGDRVYAYTILDEWQGKIRKDYSELEKIQLKTFQNRMSYLAKFKQFLSSLDLSKLNLAKINTINAEELDKIKLSFKKADLRRIEAMDSLITVMGGENTFIKLAIESSFFFDPDTARERHNQIATFITDINNNSYTSDKKKYGLFDNDGDALPARKSQKTGNSKTNDEGYHSQDTQDTKDQWYYIDEQGVQICPINKDGNGNARVCQLINQNFGYNFALKGKVKPFKNFIISHIWGRAIDPRYFTNLWNIVIVPAWANHLLDKDADKGSLASKFKATIMNLCIQHYGFDKMNWTAKVPKPSIKNDEDLLEGKYRINVIKKLDGDHPYDTFAGPIEKISYDVKKKKSL